MDKLLYSIIDGKEWIFSGIGGTIIVSILNLLKKNNKKKTEQTEKQVHIEGNQNIVGNSNSFQINVKSNNEADLRIVDVFVNNSKERPALDIKVRNLGDQVAFIKEIVFNIYDYYVMLNPQNISFNCVPPSYVYDVILDDEKVQNYKISQAIKANCVDRFQIKMASSIAKTNMPTIYCLSLDIIYNEDNKSVKSDKIIVPLPSTDEVAGCFICGVSMENAKKNYIQLNNFNKYDAVKTKAFIDILKSYENNKKEFMNYGEDIAITKEL